MKRHLLIAGTIIVVGVLASFLLFPAAPSFPPIQPGVYFGELRGFDGKEDSRLPLYVESIAKTSSLLIVPIVGGIEPELHPFIPSPDVRGAYTPVVVRLAGNSVSLAGTKEGDGYSGTLQPAGTWSLHPIDAKKLREDTTALQASVDLPRWLQLKAQAAQTSAQLDQLKETFTKEKDRLKNLEELLGNQNLLKQRSQARRESLAEEINRVTERKRKLAEEMRSTLDDLSVLHRIRLDGQAIEVARRILKREERWFDSNAGDGITDESLEEQLAANDKVDLAKLNAAAKRAEEIQELRRSLAQEQSQVQILSTEYQRRLVHRVPPPGRRE